jgi:hypothetical protein
LLTADSDLLFGLYFYVVLGLATEFIGTETIVEDKENLLYKCTEQSFVSKLLRRFAALSIKA